MQIDNNKPICFIGGGGLYSHMNVGFENSIIAVESDFISSNDKALILSDHISYISEKYKVIISIGDPKNRERIYNLYPNLSFVNIISPHAFIHPTAKIGSGCYIGENVTIGANTVLGDHVIVQHNASIAHDVKLNDFITVCPSASINGNVIVGNSSFIGGGSSIKDGVIFPPNSILAMGGVYIGRNYGEGIYIGVPTKYKSN